MKAETRLVVLFLALAGTAEGGVFGPARRVPTCDAWAMAVCTEGDRLYVAAGKSLQAYDISSPLEPRILGAVDGMDNRRQVVARDGLVYVVSRETGMRVVDARDPRNMRILSRFDSVEFATGIDVAGKVAFLSERINGVECVDISDPGHPAHICIRRTAESQSNRYRDGYLYSGEWGAGEVTVFDARDMKNFHEVARLPLHGFGDGLELDGNYLYCSTGHDAKRRREWSGVEAVGRGRGLDIFELTDPAHPKPVGRVDFPRFEPRNEDFWTVRVADGTAYCADSHNGLFAVDVSDPSRPRVVDRLCVPQPGKPDWPSGAISSLAVGKGCLYVTSFPGGLLVVPVEGLKPAARPQGEPPRHPAFREPYPTDPSAFHVYRPARPGQARTAVVRGDLVYAAFGDAGLHVLRIVPGTGFEKLGELPGRQVYDCCFCGDRLVTAEGLDGFAVYALEGPTVFREVARRARLSDTQSVAFWTWAPDDRTLLLTGRNGGRYVFRADHLEGRSLLSVGGTCQWDKYPADRAIGGVLPVLNAYRGIQWVDLRGEKPRMAASDPSLPAGQTCGICAFGDRFLFTHSLKDHKLGDPSRSVGAFCAFAGPDMKLGPLVKLPKVPGWGPNGAPADFVGVPRSDGRFVALNGRSTRRIAVFDFADPARPVFSRAYRTSGQPDLIAFHQGRIVVPCGHQGLLLEK